MILKKNFARQRLACIEGRDIGTYVFPNADYKFFLTADILVRAQRRYNDNNSVDTNLDDILNDLKQRDKLDENRKHSPLRISDDAIVIDTSNLNIKDQVNRIVNIINK